MSRTEAFFRRIWRHPEARVCLALVVMTFAVFGQALAHDFVNFDDTAYVYENPVVPLGLTLKGLAWAFSFHVDNWHPLTWMSHMLDCQLFGLNPSGHHLTNVLLHAATVAGLFLLLRRVTGAIWRSAFVAAVFAIHPLRVESVAWVAERKDVLSGFFFVLTLWAYVRFIEQRRKSFYGLCLICFVLGLMSKPMLVTVPVILFLLDFWPLRRRESLGLLALEKLPFIALSAGCCILTVLAQKQVIHASESIMMPTRLANAVVACGIYLRQMFWPSCLIIFYPYAKELPYREVALAGLLLAGILTVAVWQWKKRPWLLVGWLWYLVMLLPVIGIVQVGEQAHADRYTYLPQIGICIAVTWLAAEWLHGRWAVIATICVLMALMVCAALQASYWKNSETLWIHVLECSPNNTAGHFGLGGVYSHEGDFDSAIDQYKKALQVNPNYEEARNNLALLLMQQGNLDEALVQYKKLLQTDTNNFDAYNNLGVVMKRKGMLDDSIAEYQKALELRPTNADVLYNLGNIYSQKGQYARAIGEYEQALKSRPNDPEIEKQLDLARARNHPAAPGNP